MGQFGLGRYPAEINGLAEELDELLDEIEVRDAGVAQFEKVGDRLFAMTPEETEKALKFLSQTPSQRGKALGKLDDTSAAVLILRARYLCLMSYKAMNFAEEFFHVPGQGYRSAAEYGARLAIKASFAPPGTSVVRRFSPYSRPR
jgi:hypothetical protein